MSNVLRRILIFGAIFMVISAAGGLKTWAAPLSTEDIAEKSLQSVVLVVSMDDNQDPIALGSGFIIAPGAIATNAHVVEGGSFWAIRLVGRSDFIKASNLLSYDRERDIALLRVDALDAPTLAMGDSDSLKIGQTVYAVGNPMGLEGTFSVGNISANRTIDGYGYIQITTPISKGSSGGPVVSQSGEVVGMATAVLKVGQNLNFAVPVNDIKKVASRIGLRVSRAGAQGLAAPGKQTSGGDSKSPQSNTMTAQNHQKVKSSQVLASWFGKKGKEKAEPSSVITLLGDRRQGVYYWPWCAEYDKIPKAERVEFKTRSQAEEQGFIPGKSCTDPAS